jgi:hypothetical protein
MDPAWPEILQLGPDRTKFPGCRLDIEKISFYRVTQTVVAERLLWRLRRGLFREINWFRSDADLRYRCDRLSHRCLRLVMAMAPVCERLRAVSGLHRVADVLPEPCACLRLFAGDGAGAATQCFL